MTTLSDPSRGRYERSDVIADRAAGEVTVPLEEAEHRQAVEAALGHLDRGRPLVYGAELRS
jgi:hypothetical protein